MARVISNMSMSLDGFIANLDDDPTELFRWNQSGPIEVPTAGGRWAFHLSEPSAAYLRSSLAGTGAMICGRRLYDIAKGWGGLHPGGWPVVVVTHEPPADPPAADPPFTFVTDGVARAVEVAKSLAGDRDVAIASPDIVRQCLDLGLIDEITVDLVPVLMGAGIRYFDRLAAVPVRLSGPTVIEGDEVTHLRYGVIREGVPAS